MENNIVWQLQMPYQMKGVEVWYTANTVFTPKIYWILTN